MKNLSLCDCLINEKVVVEKVNSDDDIKRRFLDIGLSYGTEVVPLYKSICGGIRAYLIRNTIIGIRDLDASNIMVRREDE